MKNYVVLCETVYRADILFKYASKHFGPVIRKVRKYPMNCIEMSENVCLYFTSADRWWFGNQRLGRHEWEIISENKFEDMLDAWVISKEE
jgi:hypothetical protein